jgi:hypothetical protein
MASGADGQWRGPPCPPDPIGANIQARAVSQDSDRVITIDRRDDRDMGAPHRIVKQDIPFHTDGEILDMVARFEECSWPYERWTHRAHLAVAVVYLRTSLIEEATRRARRNIQNYNRARGDPDGYHETLTVFFMRLIDRWLREHAGGKTLVEIVADLARGFTMRSLLDYYSSERLWSSEAKAAWVEPDLKPWES